MNWEGIKSSYIFEGVNCRYFDDYRWHDP